MDLHLYVIDVFDLFASMCQTKYTCDFSLTIDEQLMHAKSRHPFITFMPDRRHKCGIKFWVPANVETNCVVKIIPYL